MTRILITNALACSGRTGKIRQNEIYCPAFKGTHVCWEIHNVEEVTVSERVNGEKNMRALIVGIAKHQTKKTRGFLCPKSRICQRTGFSINEGFLTVQVFIGERMQQNADVQKVPGITGNVFYRSGGRSQKADFSRFDAQL